MRISGSNAGYTMFRGSVKGTGYPLHSPVSTSLPLPCVTVCHRISTGLYHPTLGSESVVIPLKLEFLSSNTEKLKLPFEVTVVLYFEDLTYPEVHSVGGMRNS